jgi:hypothetical protein
MTHQARGATKGQRQPTRVKTRIFDPAAYIDTDEARSVYLTDALGTGRAPLRPR